MSIHVPVLLNEVLEILNPQSNEKFIDGTLGEGGHAVAILKRIGPKGKLLAIDWDEKIISSFKPQVSRFKNVVLVNDSFDNLVAILKGNKFGKADGLLLDLGFSSWHLEKSGRGFSFIRNEPLVMLYHAELSETGMRNYSEKVTAAEVVNSFREEELKNIIRTYGEERYAGKIARQIIRERKIKSIITTYDLVEVIKKAVPKNYERGRIHPATRTFLALRIFVNEELENLKKVLSDLPEILRVGGRIAIISFNSLEDRIIKQSFREKQKSGLLEIITKKPIRPSIQEIRQNPRSRSAKLRAAIINQKK